MSLSRRNTQRFGVLVATLLLALFGAGCTNPESCQVTARRTAADDAPEVSSDLLVRFPELRIVLEGAASSGFESENIECDKVEDLSAELVHAAVAGSNEFELALDNETFYVTVGRLPGGAL